MLPALIGFGIGWAIKATLFEGGPVSFWKAFGIGVLIMLPVLALTPDAPFASILGANIALALWVFPNKSKPESITEIKLSKKTTSSNRETPIKTRTSEFPEKSKFIKANTTQLSEAHDDERFYEQVAAEFNDGTIKQGLWLKAETKARGNQDEARALYIEWRVGQLVESESELRKEAVRKQEEADAVREQEEAEAVRKQVEAENKREQIEASAERERSQKENERTGRDAAIVFAIGIVVFIMIVGLGQCN